MTRKFLSISFLLLTAAAAAVAVALYTRPNQLFGYEHEYWGYRFEPVEARDNIVFLSFTGDEEVLEMTRISELAQPIADTVISDKIVMFKSLFEKQRIGYRGQHTEYIECPERFKPKYFEKQLESGYLRYFVGFATERFSFGACSDEDVRYKAINAYLYCNNVQTMFDIDYFGPMKNDGQGIPFVDKIDCAS